MEWFLKVVRDNYANFDGRARRKEYWMFSLISFAISTGISILANTISGYLGFLSIIYSLAVFIPSIAVGVRRMHDVGKSGWFILIPFYNLYLAVSEGHKEENEYGLNPKDEENVNLYGNEDNDDLMN